MPQAYDLCTVDDVKTAIELPVGDLDLDLRLDLAGGGNDLGDRLPQRLFRGHRDRLVGIAPRDDGQDGKLERGARGLSHVRGHVGAAESRASGASDRGCNLISI